MNKWERIDICNDFKKREDSIQMGGLMGFR